MKIKDVWTRLILFADKFFTADTPIKNPVCGYLDGFATIEYLQPLSFYMYLNHCLRTVNPKGQLNHSVKPAAQIRMLSRGFGYFIQLLNNIGYLLFD